MKNAVWLSISIIFDVVSTAFVAMYMWQWFIVRPLGLPSLSFLQMLGLVGLKEILFYNWNYAVIFKRKRSKKWLLKWFSWDSLLRRMRSREDAMLAIGGYVRYKELYITLIVLFGDILIKSLILAFGYGLQFWTA